MWIIAYKIHPTLTIILQGYDNVDATYEGPMLYNVAPLRLSATAFCVRSEEQVDLHAFSLSQLPQSAAALQAVVVAAGANNDGKKR